MTFDVEHFSYAYWPFEYMTCLKESLAHFFFLFFTELFVFLFWVVDKTTDSGL